MASPLPNNPFARTACLPCFSCNGQAKDKNTPNHIQMPRKNSDHTSKLEMKQTEDLLASEMNRLSMQERANAFADVHCVGEDIQETPEMVQRSLEEFENTVQKERNPVYEMAVNQNRAYVEDPKFRLKFLRAKLYDARKSVRQMMSFLEQKAKYFGNDKVAREIDLSDLSKEDMELMLSGLYHIQEGRDRMGRVIVHFFGKNLSTCKADDLIRALYYIWWAIIIPLPEVQRKGVAAIYNDTARENHGMPDFNFFKETLLFFTSLPVRFSVTHYCRHAELGRTLTLNDPLLSFVLDRLPTYFRTRTRIHHRSSMELQYQLQSHGIPTDTLPLDVDGNIREDILNLWFDKHVKESNQNNLFHQAKVVQTAPEAMEADNSLLNHAPVDANEDEARNALMKLRKAPGDQIRGSDGNSESDDLATAVIKPTDNDLLFGKGYRLQMHPGNIRVREQVLRTRDEYENTPRMKRREISMRLAQMFRSNGVRFLKKAESGEWIESSIVEADKKIGQIFREFRKKEQRGRPNASRA